LSILRNRLWPLRELRGPSELALFAYITAFAGLVPLLMRLPLPRLAALVTRPPRRTTRASGSAERLDRLVSFAPTVAHPLVRSGCLTRGVTLFWFLRRTGLDVELRFGLDPADGDAGDGHCWLTLDGEPFLEDVDPRPRFTELYRLPVQRA
jgi:hypothetical protein